MRKILDITQFNWQKLLVLLRNNLISELYLQPMQYINVNVSIHMCTRS